MSMLMPILSKAMLFPDECGTDLEIVGLDPIELDIYEEKDDDFKVDDGDEFEY